MNTSHFTPPSEMNSRQISLTVGQNEQEDEGDVNQTRYEHATQPLKRSYQDE